ncbi:hypothetical protein LAJ19_20240 (plasmid) [Deinococcus taeanensis]|uniref:hypothetical protein n=1 Tax=Deinococcus taeanensis TaxID=2737050 RepID=UPI001CDBA62C|nr:hypothetical protein [Deinococcus taeanensis]UBV45458.1 hypothetical protein LAJ19_20240 [Deinococcus taeanensis]
MKIFYMRLALIPIVLAACGPLEISDNANRASEKSFGLSREISEGRISFVVNSDQIEQGYALSVAVAEAGIIKQYISSRCGVSEKEIESCEIERFFYTPSMISPVLKNKILVRGTSLIKKPIGTSNNFSVRGNIESASSEIIAVYYKIGENIRSSPGFVHIPIDQTLNNNTKMSIFVTKKSHKLTTSTLYQKVER